jgi:hypothetical protein
MRVGVREQCELHPGIERRRSENVKPAEEAEDVCESDRENGRESETT